MFGSGHTPTQTVIHIQSVFFFNIQYFSDSTQCESQWIVLVCGENENLYFCFVNAEFYRVVWPINALLTISSEMLPFSENNQKIKMFGVPPNTLP